MNFEFDNVDLEKETFNAACLYLKDGYEDHYDPIIVLEIKEQEVVIDNSFNTYRIPLSSINKITMYKRTPFDDYGIDCLSYEDHSHVVVWEK